jgi:hypothetical protein
MKTLALFGMLLAIISCEDEGPRFCYQCTYQYEYTDGTSDTDQDSECGMMTEEAAREFTGRKSHTKNLTYNKEGMRTVMECNKVE